MKRIEFIQSKLSGKEKLYLESILLLKKSLSFNKSNINVSRDLLNQSITILDELSDYLPKDDYKIAKNISYNYLGITYMNQIVSNGSSQEDKNKINHAISLFKKALRFNGTKSAYSSFTVYNNLAYANNVIGNYREALEYTKEMEDLLKNSNQKVYLYNKVYCNYTDSYNLLNDESNTSKYYSICIDGINRLKYLRQEVLNLIKKDKVEIHPEIKISNTNHNRNLIIVLTGLIVFVGALFWFNKRKLSRLIR